MHESSQTARYTATKKLTFRERIAATLVSLFTYAVVAMIFALFIPLFLDMLQYQRTGFWHSSTIASMTGMRAHTEIVVLDFSIDWLAARIHVTVAGFAFLWLSLLVLIRRK